MQSRDQICHAPLPCLVPRPHFSSRPKRFGSRGPCENVPRIRHRKRIDREGLAKRRTGTRQPVTQARSLPNPTEAVNRMATVRIFENLVVLRRLLTLSVELIT